MKTYAYIPLLTLIAVSAFSAETIHEEASMKAGGRLNVSNVSGSVEIKGWSKKKIEVTGELGDDSSLIFKVEDNSARVEVEFEDNKRRRHHRNLDDSDLVIYVPHSTRVSATTVSADLTVEEIKGVQRLQTVSGDLETQVFDQEAVVKSVSGEIVVSGDGSHSQLTVGTVSGDVDVVDVAGEITARSVSGDVDVQASEFNRLKMDTVSGDVDFRGKLQSGGRIDGESVSGDIQLELGSLYNTEYFLESFSGDIGPILDRKAKRTSKYAPGSKLELTEGDGDSRVRIETMSGDIDITGSEKPRRKPQVQQTSQLKSRSHAEFAATTEALVKDMEQLSRDVSAMAEAEARDLEIDTSN